ncbi:MAG: tetrahydromethanopterin S-methyltransferase subunit D [Methanophagales archaeon ANME-1-THS]|nr:MAG: tetrahydromethanopterin S-methyltransferase subunit D [Methanophagales archaeon ANME-1-THS]
MTIEPELIWIVVYVTIGGMLGCLGAHLLPVGGAPAAMGTATGIATGTVQIMLGAVVTGLFTAATVSSFSNNIWLVSLAGAVGATIMIQVVMFMANVLYAFGCGVVPVSGRVAVDPITKAPQTAYKTPQTDGHGVPDVVFISGTVGGFMGGFGGALMYFALLFYANFMYGTAVIAALSIFVANAILAAYNIRGTTEGYWDPKFKKMPKALIGSFCVSVLAGIVVMLATIALGGGA